MKRTNSRIRRRQSESRFPEPSQDKLPLIEHLYELRRRVFYVALSVGLFSALAYAVEHSIVSALIKPAGEQTFVYTSPMDGINFLFRLCLYAGIALSIPVIVYQFLRYLEPLFTKSSMRLIIWGSIASGALALAGMAFGYFIGLPAALHFLLYQFRTDQIKPLLTIQSYMSFVTMYMLVSAVLFQVPLFLIFINRIRPLKPKKLLSFKCERWVILGGFVLGALMNPDPNLLHQIVIVGPLILMYQVGVGIVWLANHSPHNTKHTAGLTRHHAGPPVVRARQFRSASSSLRSEPIAQRMPVNNLAAVQAAMLIKHITPGGVATKKRRQTGGFIDDFIGRRPYRTNTQRLPRTGDSIT